MGAQEIIFLEGEIAHPADHQHAHAHAQKQGEVRRDGSQEIRKQRGEKDKGHHSAAARRNGQADEKTFAHGGGADVEARQAQSPAGRVDERRGHA